MNINYSYKKFLVLSHTYVNPNIVVHSKNIQNIKLQCILKKKGGGNHCRKWFWFLETIRFLDHVIHVIQSACTSLEATTLSTIPHLKRPRVMCENPALHKIASRLFRGRRRGVAFSPRAHGRVDGFDWRGVERRDGSRSAYEVVPRSGTATRREHSPFFTVCHSCVATKALSFFSAPPKIASDR